jgi:probable HAF family extracellular repeat protein
MIVSPGPGQTSKNWPSQKGMDDMKYTVRLLTACLALALLLSSTSFSRDGAGPAYAWSAQLLATAARSDANFTYSKIDFPGAAATTAAGINARGDIVGNYVDSAGVTHGLLLREGVFSTIDYPGVTLTAARGINARGDIVGRVLDSSGGEHGFLLRDGSFSQVDYPGAAATTARGINNAGDITGRHFSSGGNESGFIWRDGSFYNVRVPSSCSTDVWMAMDNGQTAVGDFCTNADDGIHGYLRAKPGNFETIDFPNAGAPCTALRWINERGDIVGVYANSLSECDAFQLHGFLLTRGQYTAVDFPGAAFTTALGVSDDGEIVGLFINQKGDTHAFKAAPINGN